MNVQKKRIDVTSADTKYLGYEYQYLYFILSLFSLRLGEKVGFEVLDDVCKISEKEKITYLLQLKYTTDKKMDGNNVNLTLLSKDLWKTLSNWAKLICDPAEKRSNQKSQLDFLEKNKFIFVTNRYTENNDFIKKIGEYKNKKIGFMDLKYLICDIKKKSSNKDIQGYIDDVLGLKEKVLKKFLELLNFDGNIDGLYTKIREEIYYKFIPQEYIDDIFAKVYLKLKEDFFDKCSNGKKQIIDFNQWNKVYGPIFDSPRKTALPLRKYSPDLPDNFENQLFVKELIEIKAIDRNNITEIAYYTTQYLKINYYLETWIEEGRITKQDEKNFESNTKGIWRNSHNKNHRGTGNNEELDNKNALSCFDELMQRELKLLSNDIEIDLSNGEFIRLANDEQIGWKQKWKERYYKDA